MKLDRELLQNLPKVLLHEHLDGVLRPETVIELAKAERYTGLPTVRSRGSIPLVPPGSEPGQPRQISRRLCPHHSRNANRRSPRTSRL